MDDDWRNHLPDGVELLADTGDGLRIRLPMPTDNKGLVMVRCPVDNEHRFGIRLKFEGASADEIYCVCCGHRAGADEFLTDDTRRLVKEYAQAIAGRYAMEQLAAEGWTVQPNPLPRTYFSYEQEPTRRTLQCGRCEDTIAVFGVAMFCPGCGRFTSIEAFVEQVAIERRTMDALSALPPETTAQMEADGALTTIYENSVKSTMTAIETLLRAVFFERLADAEKALKTEKRSGNVFQRLRTDVEPLYLNHLSVDLPNSLGSAWDGLLEAMATRHVLTHASGFVDQKYLAQVPHSMLTVGQRLTITRDYVDGVLVAAMRVGELLAPPPTSP